MFTSLHIRNFRCHEDLHIPELARLNVVAGKNNVGKSTLLEAVFILCGAHNPAMAVGADARRGLDRVEIGVEPPWASLHRGYDGSRSIRLEGTLDNATSQTVTLRTISHPDSLNELVRSLGDLQPAPSVERQPIVVFAALELRSQRNGSVLTTSTLLRSDGFKQIPEALPPPPFPAHILEARRPAKLEDDADLFSKLQIAGRDGVVLDGLRVIEPELASLSLQRIAGQTVLHGKLPGLRLIPVPLMGEGMQRMCTLLLRIAHSPGGIVLVDEIENGFHHTVLPDVWRVIERVAADTDVQVFATTHSAECIEAAARAFADAPAVFRLHRVDRVNGRTAAATYDLETLRASFEMGIEVR